MKGGMVGWDRKPAAVGEDRRARSRMDGWRKDRRLLQHAHDQEKCNAPCCRSIQSFKAVCVCERTGELLLLMDASSVHYFDTLGCFCVPVRTLAFCILAV